MFGGNNGKVAPYYSPEVDFTFGAANKDEDSIVWGETSYPIEIQPSPTNAGRVGRAM